VSTHASRLGLTEPAAVVRPAHESELLIESTYEELQRDFNTPSRILTLPVDRGQTPRFSRGPERIVAMG
jgi:hypothetical protein